MWEDDHPHCKDVAVYSRRGGTAQQAMDGSREDRYEAPTQSGKAHQEEADRLVERYDRVYLLLRDHVCARRYAV